LREGSGRAYGWAEFSNQRDTMADSIDRNMPASLIAAKFGGPSALGRAMDPPRAPSTVHRWLESGLIPAKHQPEVLAAAKRHRIRLSASDFLPRAVAA
jgi:hypothetical protein